MVAIGFATALGAGAVAFATILMVVSPAESEWQARPVAASMAAENTGSTTSAERVAPDATASASSAPAIKAASTQARADGSAVPLAVRAAATGGVTVQRPTVALPQDVATAAPEPDNQRWARSAQLETAVPQRLAVRSALENEAGGEATARGDADEQMAALPLSALVAEPARPAEPALEDDEQGSESAEPSRKLRLSSSANLRARPKNGAKVLGTISGGTSVSSFGCKGGWCEVSADGKRGFIAAKFLGEKAKVRRASASSKKRAARSIKQAPQRKAAAVAAAPAAPTPTLPGVFATEPAATNSDR